ncbi:MAG: ATP-binding protein [Leptospirales bacterium]|nr:ATP-binding protein [Leptospirales bacterium]
MSDSSLSNLETHIDQLRREIRDLQSELEAVRLSPFIQSSIASMCYQVVINREEVVQKELHNRIDEKLGTMFEIKNQAKRFAHLLGVDEDNVRLMVTEALQNLIEHGYGRFAEVRFEIKNDLLNPYLICTFKHEMPAGERYTMTDINRNALKADITSEYFDFESSRGRGEFIMKQLTDERRIINGIEMNREGRKSHYFKRILINYKDPNGPKERINFAEIKDEIDRLDYEDVICCFHVDFQQERPNLVTIACVRHNLPKVAELLRQSGYEMIEQEPYFRTVFASFRVPETADREQLIQLFAQVKQIVYQERDARNPETADFQSL